MKGRIERKDSKHPSHGLGSHPGWRRGGRRTPRGNGTPRNIQEERSWGQPEEEERLKSQDRLLHVASMCSFRSSPGRNSHGRIRTRCEGRIFSLIPYPSRRGCHVRHPTRDLSRRFDPRETPSRGGSNPNASLSTVGSDWERNRVSTGEDRPGDAGVQTTFESQLQRTMKPRTMHGKMPCASRKDRRCVADTWRGKKNPSLGMVCAIRNGRHGKDIPRKMGQPHVLQNTSTPCHCIPTRFPLMKQCCNRLSPSVCGCPHQRIQQMPLPGIPDKHRCSADTAAPGCEGQSSQAL